MLLLFSSSQNRAYRHFLEPESCVPAAFLDKNSGTHDFDDFLQISLLAAIWTQSQIHRKNDLFRPLFDPNRKFLEKMPSSAPFVGGTTAGPEKRKITIKKQQETIMKNPGTIFEVQVPEIVGKSSISLFFQSKSSKKWGYARIRLEKNSGTQESGSIKIVVRTMLLLFFSRQNRGYRQFLEPELCVPAFYRQK